MKKQLRTIRFLTVLLLVSMLLITGCRSTKPGGKGGGGGDTPIVEGYTGDEVLALAAGLGLGYGEQYPETVTVGGKQISLADSVYLMAKWIVLFDGTNEETGQPGKVPEIVPYKQISLPNKVTPGKTDGVILWSSTNQLAQELVNALEANPQLPDEIKVLWHPSGYDWVDLKKIDGSEETIGINIVISVLARSINWTKTHDWTFANYAGVRGGDLPASWPKPAEDPVTYALTLAAAPADGGVVTDNTNAGPYAEGAKINVTATANEGYNFVNWTVDGEEASDQATFEYTMPAKNVTLTANFAKQVFFAGTDIVTMAGKLGLASGEKYPEKLTVGGNEISLADSVYLMAQWLVLFDGTNEEPGTVPELVPYKEISIPSAVTEGKTDGVVVWHNVNKLANDIVDALDDDPQIPDEITVLWHPSGDWGDIKDMPATEETLGINIVISILARTINWAKDHDWMFANFSGVRGGDLPASWPQYEGD